MEIRIKELRIGKVMSQGQLAEIVGISQQTLSKIENNIYLPPVDILLKLAEYFNVTCDYLLGMTNFRSCEDEEEKYYFYRNYKEEFIIFAKLSEENKQTAMILIKRLIETQTRKD